MNPVIESFIKSKRIAIVGASANPRSFGYAAFTTLKKNGYELYPVNPNYAEIEKGKCYSSITELPQGIESALFVLSPGLADQAVMEAKKSGIKRIWFQQGGKYSSAIKKAQDEGIEIVSQKCILMYAQPVTSIHAFHRFFVKLLGRL
jgi:uncharacterized protein